MHLAGPRSQQHPGGLRHGAAGGVNVVAQEHALACYEPLSRPAQREAASELIAPLLGRQLKEGRRGAHPLQYMRLKFAATLL